MPWLRCIILRHHLNSLGGGHTSCCPESLISMIRVMRSCSPLQCGNRATQMVCDSVKEKKYCMPALCMAVLQPRSFYVLCCSNMHLHCAEQGY